MRDHRFVQYCMHRCRLALASLPVETKVFASTTYTDTDISIHPDNYHHLYAQRQTLDVGRISIVAFFAKEPDVSVII